MNQAIVKDWRGTDFSGQNLRCRSFAFADLRGCNFSGCDLTGADFRYADIRGANFAGSDLTRTDFGAARDDDAYFDPPPIVEYRVAVSVVRVETEFVYVEAQNLTEAKALAKKQASETFWDADDYEIESIKEVKK